MVKTIIIILLFIATLDSIGQKYPVEIRIDLSISFSKDTVYFGDSLKIELSYKNKSDADVVFSPKAIIGMNHYHPDAFISYDTPQRIMYSLSNNCSNDEDVNLKPNEIFFKTYDIKADSSFFYKGQNDICVFYHFFKKEERHNQKYKNILHGSLWSHAIQIFVKKAY